MSKHQIQPACGERARLDGRICLAGLNSRAQTGTGKSSFSLRHFSLFSRPRAGFATRLTHLFEGASCPRVSHPRASPPGRGSRLGPPFHSLAA